MTRAVRQDGQEHDDRDNLHRIQTKQNNTSRPAVNSWTATMCLTWEESTTSELISES